MNLSYERLAICPSVHHCLGNLLHEQDENERRLTEQELTADTHPYIRPITVRYLNNSWPLLVVSRRLLIILMPHQQVTQKDVADNHF